MKLVVVSHKRCWPAPDSGYATDGGFPRQMAALASLFDETTLVVPCVPRPSAETGAAIEGRSLTVLPLTPTRGRGQLRKLGFPFWTIRNLSRLVRAIRAADVVHAAIPGDVGMLGAALAVIFGKRLFVRHCGNWHARRTLMDRVRRFGMERLAGPERPMFATGAESQRPSARNDHVRWVFATSLSRGELTYWRKERRAPGNEPSRLVTVGRQEEGKGTREVIDALPALEEAGLNVHFDVVGDGSALEGLRGHARDLSVEPAVTFHGRLTPRAVLETLDGCDLFLLLSRSEGFPKAVVEAMACGLPVVATSVSALPELLKSGAGALVSSTSPDVVAATVQRCLDAATYHSMSVQALDTARRLSLEAWAIAIEGPLKRAWGPLKNDAK